MNFALAVYKPTGLSSSDVVIKCRNALSAAAGGKIRCGHMGTLDPAAEGVLVLGFGKAAKLFDHIQNCKKTYRATFTFGSTTDTLDREGEITESDGRLPDEKALNDVLPLFVGEINQVPPAYSALNVNGVRAYKLARKGENVTLAPRQVKIYSLKTVGTVISADGKIASADVEIVCGSGTYIRSLCRDVAEKAGVLAYMSSLVRTECAGYTITEAVPLQDFLSDPLSHVRKDSEILEKLFPTAVFSPDTAKRLKFGQTVPTQLSDGRYGAFSGDETLGVALVKDGYVKLETHLWNTI